MGEEENKYKEGRKNERREYLKEGKTGGRR
jgi:hypothetical protein